MSGIEIPDDYKFPCYWCGGIRFVDPRRKGNHIRCAVMGWWRRARNAKQ